MRDVHKIAKYDASKVKSPLFAIVLGASGAGKSSLIGTAPGPVLHIHFSEDISGTAFAANGGNDLRGYLVDPTEVDGKPYSADEAINDMFTALSDPTLSKTFKTVAIDGLAALEGLIGRSEACLMASLSKAGKPDSFAKDRYVSETLSRLVRVLIDQRAKGVHTIVTSLARVSEDTEGNTSIQPKLRGFGVLESLLPSFATILFVARDNNTRSHVLDMTMKISKKKIDGEGNTLAVAAFSTRIEGLSIDDTPGKISPDLKKIIALQHRDVKFTKKEEKE